MLLTCRKGTLQTPQVLELSGIGNPDILNKFGIKTLVDLPGVGENLRKSLYAPSFDRGFTSPSLEDHVGVSTIVEVEPIEVTVDDLVDPAILKKQEDL